MREFYSDWAKENRRNFGEVLLVRFDEQLRGEYVRGGGDGVFEQGLWFASPCFRREAVQGLDLRHIKGASSQSSQISEEALYNLARLHLMFEEYIGEADYRSRNIFGLQYSDELRERMWGEFANRYIWPHAAKLVKENYLDPYFYGEQDGYGERMSVPLAVTYETRKRARGSSSHGGGRHTARQRDQGWETVDNGYVEFSQVKSREESFWSRLTGRSCVFPEVPATVTRHTYDRFIDQKFRLVFLPSGFKESFGGYDMNSILSRGIREDRDPLDAMWFGERLRERFPNFVWSLHDVRKGTLSIESVYVDGRGKVRGEGRHGRWLFVEEGLDNDTLTRQNMMQGMESRTWENTLISMGRNLDLLENKVFSDAAQWRFGYLSLLEEYLLRLRFGTDYGYYVVTGSYNLVGSRGRIDKYALAVGGGGRVISKSIQSELSEDFGFRLSFQPALWQSTDGPVFYY